MTELWFKIQCIYPITSSLNQFEGNEEDDEDEVLKRIRMKDMDITDGYEIDFAYLNLVIDPIVSVLPCCMLPKNAKYKKYYSEVVLESGNIIFAVGKPESVMKLLMEYLNVSIQSGQS